VEQHSYNDEVRLKIGLPLGSLLWHYVVDKAKKGTLMISEGFDL